MVRKTKGCYAFLDTNIYLHFRGFDEIDWRKVLDCRIVCLVVAPTNLTELEKFKYDRVSERRRERAKQNARKIADLALTVATGNDVALHGREGVSLRILTTSPSMANYPQLQSTNPDDELIATVIQFVEQNPSIPQDDIFLVTDDSGVLIKGRANKLNIVRLDDKYRLPDEPTLDQQKIAALERRLREVENRQPHLRLACLQDDHLIEEIRFEIRLIAKPAPEEIAKLLDRAISGLWHPTGTTQATGGTGSTISPAVESIEAVKDILKAVQVMASIPDYEIDRYEKEKREYIEKYRSYLYELYDRHEIMNRCWLMNNVVLNEGTAPATGLVIHLDVPDEIKIFEEGDLPEAPEEPDKPAKPMTAFERIAHLTDFRISLPLLHSGSGTRIDMPRLVDSDQTGPEIKRHHSTRVEWKRSKALQQLPLHLTPIWIVLPALEGEHHYAITYALFAENIPTPVEGSLSITAVGTPAEFKLW